MLSSAGAVARVPGLLVEAASLPFQAGTAALVPRPSFES